MKRRIMKIMDVNTEGDVRRGRGEERRGGRGEGGGIRTRMGVDMD
jgi:hypothetical protein